MSIHAVQEQDTAIGKHKLICSVGHRSKPDTVISKSMFRLSIFISKLLTPRTTLVNNNYNTRTANSYMLFFRLFLKCKSHLMCKLVISHVNDPNITVKMLTLVLLL